MATYRIKVECSGKVSVVFNTDSWGEEFRKEFEKAIQNKSSQIYYQAIREILDEYAQFDVVLPKNFQVERSCDWAINERPLIEEISASKENK